MRLIGSFIAIGKGGGGAAALKAPISLTSSRVTGGVKLDWVDTNSGNVGYQVYVTYEGIDYVQLGEDTEVGAITYTHNTTSHLPLNYKVRAVRNDEYSDFTTDVTEIIPISCLAYYPLNTGGIDKSGNNYHLPTTGAISTTDKDGTANSAYSFTTTGKIIGGINIPPLSTITVMSFACWIKPASLTDVGVISAVTDNDSGNANYVFAINTPAKRLKVIWGAFSVASNTDLVLNEWVHVGFVRTGSAGSWTTKIYLNGVEDGSGSTAVNFDAGGTRFIGIGNYYFVTSGYPYHGLIDDVVIYNSAKTEAQMLAIKNDGVYKLPEPSDIFYMSSHTDSALSVVRDNINDLIWPTGLPTNGVDSITTGVSEVMASSSANLDSIDQLTIEISGIVDRTPYVWHPQTPNGKFVIFHMGHFVGTTGTDIYESAGQANLIRALIDNDYTVAALWMPPSNAGAEGGLHSYLTVTAPYNTVDDLHLFLDSVVRVINEYEGSFNEFYVCGLSGGGWTTTLNAALDTRITKSAQIAGSLPVYNCNMGGLLRDWEQYLPYLNYKKLVTFCDLYLMACSNGRKQKHYLNANEPIFNLAIYNIKPFATEMAAKNTDYELVWDNVTTLHVITSNVKDQVIAFFNA